MRRFNEVPVGRDFKVKTKFGVRRYTKISDYYLLGGHFSGIDLYPNNSFWNWLRNCFNLLINMLIIKFSGLVPNAQAESGDHHYIDPNTEIIEVE